MTEPIGHKTGIRSLRNTEERQQNDPSSHKDGEEQGCHYLSIGMTDWNFSLIASSFLRTDRNLGTPPTKQETCFRAYLKIPYNIFSSQMGGFLAFTRQTRSKTGKVNQSHRKRGRFYFNSCSVLGRPEDSDLSCDSLKWNILGVSQEYSKRVINIFLWRL